MGKEIAVKKSEELAIPSELLNMFDVNDNIKGVTGRIPVIKIIHQAQMFSDKDGDVKFLSIEGIILHHSPVNSYWENSFDETGGGVPPDCYSMDSEIPQGDKQQSKLCYNCPMNKFGSKGRGKACKNMWRLHILCDDSQIPKRMTIPPSNILGVQDFLVKLRDLNLPHELAKLKITLKKAKSKDGIEYSQLNFDIVDTVKTKAEADRIKAIKTSFSGAFGDIVEADEVGEDTTKL